MHFIWKGSDSPQVATKQKTTKPTTPRPTPSAPKVHEGAIIGIDMWEQM